MLWRQFITKWAFLLKACQLSFPPLVQKLPPNCLPLSWGNPIKEIMSSKSKTLYKTLKLKITWPKVYKFSLPKNLKQSWDFSGLNFLYRIASRNNPKKLMYLLRLWQSLKAGLFAARQSTLTRLVLDPGNYNSLMLWIPVTSFRCSKWD